jgi:hypothetical protein
MRDWSGLLLLGVIAVPVLLLVLYLRKPVDPGGVPRDSIATKGKGEVKRPLGVLPSEAFDDLLRDQAADKPKKADEPPSD